MEFDNSFSVKAPIERVWAIMIDAEEVAPCVPGAQLVESVDKTHHKGTVKIKLGAVQMTYRGELEMQPDEAARVIVLRAKGTETRGSGGASGVITNRLSEPEPGVTKVDIHSQIDVTGRVAQFGRGIMQDVATRLIKDFSACLEAKVSAVPAGESGGSEAAPSPPSGEQVDQPAPPGTPRPTTTTTTPSIPRAYAAPSEIKAMSLIADVARSRLAALLRAAAGKIEPR